MILWIDYETFYSDDFSIKKIDGRKACRTEYIHDPRFQCHGMAASIDGGDDFWVTRNDLQSFWGDMAPHIDAVCAHNGVFDHAITAKYFTGKRFFLLDTLSMAQGWLGAQLPKQGLSLDALAKFYFPNDPSMWKQEGGLDPSKGKTTLNEVEERLTAAYACQDNKVCRGLFQKLLAEPYPWHTELHNISLTLAMAVYPVLVMDNIKAAKIHAHESRIKAETVQRLGITRADLRSGAKFAAILESLGVDVPMKESPKKPGEMIYAFAAKDSGMVELLEHDDPQIQAVAEARVGEKASQMESRAATFARLPSPLPVPLQYASAHTGRHGGREFNIQNLKRGSDLRGCIMAPPGHRLVVADLSQIELRMNAWWCGEDWLVEALEAGRDVYCELATEIFKRPITKADEHERFIGKQGELSCGYGSGWAKVLSSLKAQKVQADEPLARAIVKAYRAKHPRIAERWRFLNDRAIPAIAGRDAPLECNGVLFEKNRTVLPSGRSIWYTGIERNAAGEWEFNFRGKGKYVLRKRIYGPALLENLIQGMSFDVFIGHARQMDAIGLHPVWVVHDEIMVVSPVDRVDEDMEKILAIQRTAPAWCSGVALKGEANHGADYKEAK